MFLFQKFVVIIGRTDLNDWTEPYLQAKIAKIEPHPEFDTSHQNFDADIAIITLKNTVPFSQYIRPACIWEEDNGKNSQFGTVVGWGYDQHKEIAKVPNKLEIPLVSIETCKQSNEGFRYITSSKMFCGGSRDGKGPCNGDSGGPLLTLYNNRWYLRGIVSVSLQAKDNGTGKCDVNNYVAFTNVAKFIDWMRKIFLSTPE